MVSIRAGVRGARAEQMPAQASGTDRPAGAGGGEAAEETGGSAARHAERPGELSDSEQARVADLERRDTEVRAHEGAHKAAGGRYAGAVQYSYTTGPDSRRYATQGEVSIDAAPVSDDPRATIEKMQVVKRAAVAPLRPSAADRAVYARASRLETQARTELSVEQAREAAPSGEASAGEASRAENQAVSPFRSVTV